MSAPAPRAPRGEARREHLLEATLRVVAADGVGAVTHRRVAKEAGLPLAATTYWFASKDELIDGAYARAVERDVVRLEELAARAPATCSARDAALALEEAVPLEDEAAREEALALSLLWLEAARHAGLAVHSRRWDVACAGACAAWLRAAGCPQEDAPGAAIALGAALDGLTTQSLAEGGPDFRRDVARPALERLVGALSRG